MSDGGAPARSPRAEVVAATVIAVLVTAWQVARGLGGPDAMAVPYDAWIYWAAGQAWLDGAATYDCPALHERIPMPNEACWIYPPWALPYTLPLQVGPPAMAVRAWIVGLGALVVGTVATWTALAARDDAPRAAVAAALVVVQWQVAIAPIWGGNLEPALAFVVTLAVLAWHHGHGAAGAVLVGVAGPKLLPWVAWAAIPSLTSRARTRAVLGVGAVGLTTAGVEVISESGWTAWSAAGELPTHDVPSVGVALGHLTGAAHAAEPAFLLPWLLLASVVGAAGLWGARAWRDAPLDAAAAILLAAVVLHPHTGDYTWLHALGPLVVALTRSRLAWMALPIPWVVDHPQEAWASAALVFVLWAIDVGRRARRESV